MMFFRLLITASVFFFAFSKPVITVPLRHQANTAPQVHIVTPDDGIVYSAGALVPYTVTVSDKEDGESKFEEIQATEIFMELHYFTDATKAAAYRKPGQKEHPGYTLFKKGDCYNCHAAHSKVIGPSFTDIAGKYKKPEDMLTMAGHIMKGSTGIWGTAVMPTHPDLTDKEAQQIARWILLAGREKNADYFRGGEGAFRLPALAKPSSDGVFILKAGYTDHGLNKSNSGTLSGQDSKRLRLH